MCSALFPPSIKSSSHDRRSVASAGLDAIIAATQRSPSRSKAVTTAPQTSTATSDDDFHSLDDESGSSGAEEEQDAEAGASAVAANGDTTAGGEAQLRERRASDKLASTSLLRDEAFLDDEGSDSSEDERPDRNTIGAVPLEWYRDEEHIGYDRCGAARGRVRVLWVLLSVGALANHQLFTFGIAHPKLHLKLACPGQAP